jgi:hypothetical protein
VVGGYDVMTQLDDIFNDQTSFRITQKAKFIGLIHLTKTQFSNANPDKSHGDNASYD